MPHGFFIKLNQAVIPQNSRCRHWTNKLFRPAKRSLINRFSQTVTCGTQSATYDYLDRSPLVGQITFATNGTAVMTTTNGYDHLNRLTHPASLGGTGFTRSQFAYRYNSASHGSHFCAYDGNGNMMALAKADGSGLTAQYKYGPSGEVIRATEPMARVNPLRFSNRYQDDETDLLIYPRRPYSASTGRWLSRDPSADLGTPPPVSPTRQLAYSDTLLTDEDEEDVTWMMYMFNSRVGLKDTYSVARHNCRRYSKYEFRDAPLHMGPP